MRTYALVFYGMQARTAVRGRRHAGVAHVALALLDVFRLGRTADAMVTVDAVKATGRRGGGDAVLELCTAG